MTDFDDALVDHLRSQADLAALVGMRIHPDYFPQNEQLPAIAYTLEDEQPEHTLEGPSGMRRAVYQVNVWASSRREAMAVARAAAAALDGFRGAMKDVAVTGAFLDGMDRERDPDTGAWCVSMRFTINYLQQEV